jgi:hypothetical protein
MNMNEILLVNPRRRRRKTATKKRRAPSRRRRNPVAANPRKRRRVRRNPVAANPRRRRRASSRRRRRNPVKAFNTRNIQGQLKTASTGALGAIALDVGLAYLPLPTPLKAGMVGKLAKGAAAIALGVVAHRFLKVSAVNANRMTEGALTVQLHGIGRELLSQFAPQVALSAYLNDEMESLGYAGSGWNPSGSLSWNDNNKSGVGAYVSPGYDGSMHDSSDY